MRRTAELKLTPSNHQLMVRDFGRKSKSPILGPVSSSANANHDVGAGKAVRDVINEESGERNKEQYPADGLVPMPSASHDCIAALHSEKINERGEMSAPT